MTVVTRRGLLFGGGAVLAALGVVYAGAVGRGALQHCHDHAPATAELESMMRVGAAWIAGSGGPAALRAEADAFRQSHAAAFRASPREALRLISSAVQGDFEAGRLVCCDGWALARTEALLCAALVLAAGEGSEPPVPALPLTS